MSFGLPWLLFSCSLVFFKEIRDLWGEKPFGDLLGYIFLYNVQQQWFWYNFMVTFILFGIGLLIDYFFGYYETVSWRLAALAIIILVIIDQAVQFFLIGYNGVIEIPIIKDWIEITTKYMKENDRFIFWTKFQLSIHIPVDIIAILFLYLLCRFYFYCLPKRGLVLVSFTLLVSGPICTMFDMLIHNYGYDYIYIYPLAIFDLKDTYLAIGEGSLLLATMQNWSILKKIKIRDLAPFFKWEFAAWRALFGRMKYLFLRKSHIFLMVLFPLLFVLHEYKELI
jgi:lipoprotein signal peptidase